MFDLDLKEHNEWKLMIPCMIPRQNFGTSLERHLKKKINSEEIFCYTQINKIDVYLLFAKCMLLWFNKNLRKCINIGVGSENYEVSTRAITQEIYCWT